MDSADITRFLQDFFSFLAVFVDVFVLVGVVGILLTRFGKIEVPLAVSEFALKFGLAIAVTCTLGSLYFSEIADYEPCRLCWFQRICMYPLAAILLVGFLRKDRKVWMYCAPLLTIGPVISIYHILLEQGVFEESSSCSATVPCSTPYFERLGIITLAWMALSGFAGIAVCLYYDTRRPSA